MKLFFLTFFVFVATFANIVKAMPKSKPAKGFRYDDIDNESLEEADKSIKFIDLNEDDNASSGRLFMRKFLFQNIFGQKQRPPVIPIIIIGESNTDNTDNTDNTGDIATVTTPSATTTTNTNTNINPPVDGTVTTGTGADTATDTMAPANPNGRIQLYGRGSKDESAEQIDEEPAVIEDQSLALADLSAGGEEYVITNQQIQDTSNVKSHRASARVNLRLRDTKRGQVIHVRLPMKYLGYFKKGQRIYLNKMGRTRPVKGRVNRRRKPQRRPNKNKNNNKRRRYISQL